MERTGGPAEWQEGSRIEFIDVMERKERRPAGNAGRVRKKRRAHGGCLGSRRRRRTRQAAKSCGEAQMAKDPQVSEWGNPSG